MVLIVIFGADLGGIVLTLNSIRITIKTTFNGYTYCWYGILYFVVFDNGSRKLIKFDKTCVLSCGTCLIHRICIRYSLRLIVTITHTTDKQLCKSYNFDALFIVELIQTKIISNEQGAPQTLPLTNYTCYSPQETVLYTVFAAIFCI